MQQIKVKYRRLKTPEKPIVTSTLPLTKTDQLLQKNLSLKQDIQLLKKQLDRSGC